MLLTGSFPRLLDDKLRFAIPKPLRDAIGIDQSILFVVPGTEGSLALYPDDTFHRLADCMEQRVANGRDLAAFNRLFYAQAQRIECDKQGRLRLPIELAELAGLQKEIILLGVRDHLEIWNRERWENYLNQTQPHYDELASKVLTGGTTPSEQMSTVDQVLSNATDMPVRPGYPR